MHHGADREQFAERFKLVGPLPGELVQQGIGLRLRQFQLPEERQRGTDFVQREADDERQVRQSDVDLHAKLRARQHTIDRRDIAARAAIDLVHHPYGPTVFNPPDRPPPQQRALFEQTPLRQHEDAPLGLVDLRLRGPASATWGSLLLASLFACRGLPLPLFFRLDRIGLLRLARRVAAFECINPRPQPAVLFAEHGILFAEHGKFPAHLPDHLPQRRPIEFLLTDHAGVLPENPIPSTTSFRRMDRYLLCAFLVTLFLVCEIYPYGLWPDPLLSCRPSQDRTNNQVTCLILLLTAVATVVIVFQEYALPQVH